MLLDRIFLWPLLFENIQTFSDDRRFRRSRVKSETLYHVVERHSARATPGYPATVAKPGCVEGST